MNAFLDELKRRRVVRAGLVYAAAAFVILQAADLLAGGLRLPPWVFTAITVVVVLGFPLTLVLAWIFEATSAGVQRTAAAAGAPAPAWLGRGTLLSAGALLALGGTLAAGWIATPGLTWLMPDETGERRAYVIASLASNDVDIRHQPDRFAVAPDGRAVVVAGIDAAGRAGLLLRRRDQIEPALLAGTGIPRAPVFSPDGGTVAYTDAGSGLMKVRLPDGQPVRVASVQGMRLTWGSDERIRMANDAGELLTVDASTGAVDTLRLGLDTLVIRGEGLPHGRLLLSIVVADTTERIVVRERDGGLRDLLEGFDARLAGDRHMLFVRQEGGARVLVAVPFDRRRASLRGETRTLLRNIAMSGTGSTPAVLTGSGDLVYMAAANRTDRRIVLVDRQGRERQISGGRAWIRYVEPSPDGSRLAAVSIEDGGRRIWSISTETGALTPVTHTGESFRPQWMPDGGHIIYTNFLQRRQLGGSMLRVPADGSAPPVPVAPPEVQGYVVHVSPDGRQLLYQDGPTQRLYLQPLQGGEPARPLLPVPLNGAGGWFSFDGKRIAFEIRADAGRFPELRIGSVLNAGAAIPIPGRGVGWSRDGRFFYRTGNDVWEIPVSEAGPQPDRARRAFTLPPDAGHPSIMPDGEHLALVRGGHLYSDLVMIERALEGNQ
jgi:Tol biopolymer transport system component